jgi:hypothetical protein
LASPLIEAILKAAAERQVKVQADATEAMHEQMTLHAEHIEKPWKWRVESVQEAVNLIKGANDEKVVNSNTGGGGVDSGSGVPI